MDLQDFHAVRTTWYQAYVAGDAGRLAELEAEAFFVASEAGIEARAARLQGIAAAVQAGRWFPSGSHVRDQQVDVHRVGDGVVSVRGVGQIMTPCGRQPQVLFTELWQRSTQGWKVLHLHYHRLST